MKISYSPFRLYAAVLLTALLCTMPLVQAKPKSYAAHAAEIARLAQVNEAGQLQIERGDALTPIAQRYAKANNLPLDVAFKALIDANPQAFEDAQNNLKVGAVLMIPKKTDIGMAKKETESVSVVPKTLDNNTSVEVLMPVEPGVIAQTPDNVSTVEVAVKPDIAQTQTVFDDFYMPPWAWVLAAVFALMLLVGVVKRGNRTPIQNSPKQLERHANGAPKVVLLPQSSEHNPSHSVKALTDYTRTTAGLDPLENFGAQSALSVKADNGAVASASHLTTAFDDEDDGLLYDEESLLDEPLLMREPMVQDRRFQRAVAGLSASSLDLTLADDIPDLPKTVVSTAAHVVPKSIANKLPESSVLDKKFVAVSVFQPNDSFFNHHFKTPRYQLAQITNATARAVTFANVKAEAMAAVKVAPEVVNQNTAPELEVDMPTFLREYSHNLPEPTFTSVDYEDLLDKARLQAWLNVHSVDEILLYAQDAHDASYDDVAQLMLNDVLLRGNAEQCAAVLNLRYLWSYPQGVY
ncbi:hypothetical protein [Formosimonas limnophila]|uniref:hypothetical protein n=1 Tax=Formosimonas limnophila TaxID=1384487 RepID=UPI00167B29CE|nr:hypothetical protein [Formosimonas limnophila]